jgi:hypothetical protein
MNAPIHTLTLLPVLSDIKPYKGLNAHGRLTHDHAKASWEAEYWYVFTSWYCTDREINANVNPYTA